MKLAGHIFLIIIAAVVTSALLRLSAFHAPDSAATGNFPSDPANRSDLERGPGPSPIEAPKILASPDVAAPSLAPEPHSSIAHDSAAELAASYAKTLQTGVFGEEPMPKFAELYLFPTEAARQAASSSEQEFFGSPIDHWSGLMEEQLRTAFGSHPFIANARVSIMCRSTQCRLQFVESTIRGQPEGELGPNSLMMLLRVAREPWFRENFADWKTQASTPVSASAAYQLVVLPRRASQQ